MFYGTIVSINNEARTVDIYYDYGMLELQVPIDYSKFLLKDGRNWEIPFHSQTQFDWLKEQCIELDGTMYEVKDLNKVTNSCTLVDKESGKHKVNNFDVKRAHEILLESITEKCALHSRLFVYPTSNSVKNNFSSSPSSKRSRGFSSVYILTKDSNNLEQVKISQRIRASALSYGYKFIENTNLSHLGRRKNFERTVVAYRDGDNNVEAIQWKLGILMYHSTIMSIIVPARLMKDGVSGATKYDTSKSDCIVFKYGTVYINYLNWIRDSTTQADDGCIKSLTSGPDIVPFCVLQNKRLRRQYNAILKRYKIHRTQPQLSTGYYISRKIVKVQHEHGKNLISLNCILRPIIRQGNVHSHEYTYNLCNPGTNLITVTCTKKHLTSYMLKDDKILLVPLVLTKLKTEIVYAAVKNEDYPKLLELNGLDVEHFNHGLKELSQFQCKHYLVNGSDITDGVIIAFKEKNPSEQDEIQITNNKVEGLNQYCDLCNGSLVLSHWYEPHSADRMDCVHWNTVNVFNKVYGNGFGSRSSVCSKGLNLYIGLKNSNRPHANTRMPKEDVMFSQMWRKEYDATYEPITQKITRALTSQAALVMKHCDHTYDRLVHKIYQETYEDIVNSPLCSNESREKKRKVDCSDGNYFQSLRRFCNYSIVTAGSIHQKCYGFCNQIHVDKNDFLEGDLSVVGRNVIKRLEDKYIDHLKVLDNLNYYKEHINTFGRIPVPTTCGYKILYNPDHSKETYSIVAFFALVGLGISVELKSDIYHYFLGSTFTHCTTVPLKLTNDGKVFIYGDEFNIFAWGAGSSSRSGRRMRSQKKRCSS